MNEVSPTWRAIARATVVTVSALLLVTTLSFAARRWWLADSISAAPGAWLVLGTFGLVALSAVQRRLWNDTKRTSRAPQRTYSDLALVAVSSAYVIVGGLSLASLASGIGWQLLVALLIIGEETQAIRGMRTTRPIGRSPAVTLDSGDANPTANSQILTSADAAVAIAPPSIPAELNEAIQGVRTRAANAEHQDEEMDEEEDAPWLPSGVTQQLTRGVDASRGEYVVGVLTVDFAAGQRTETLHVSFCPPLARTPKIQLQPVEGPPMTATVGQAEAFGARFELRLARAWEEPQRAVLQFETHEPEDVPRG